MTIRPFLANQAFDQEAINEMSAALRSVCRELGLDVIDDGATRLVAEKNYRSRATRDPRCLGVAWGGDCAIPPL
jgi:hypothetical protein